MARRVYLPIAVELPERKGVLFEVLPKGTFNQVTVYQRTRSGLRKVKNPAVVQRVVREMKRQHDATEALAKVHRADQAPAARASVAKGKKSARTSPRLKLAALLSAVVFALLWGVVIRGCV